jgi:hypothetical protein
MTEPMNTEFLDGAINILRAITTRDDFFEAVATMTKKHFDSLVRVGFTEEQATRIVAGYVSKPDK